MNLNIVNDRLLWYLKSGRRITIPVPGEKLAGSFNTDIWLDESQRPREYAGLDWVKARSLLHPFLELSAPKGDETLVDLGTGTGAILNYLAPHVGTAVGVDISSAMLSQVSRLTERMALLQADARGAVALRSEAADIVTTRMMLHDLESPGDALREAWRLVKPGGKLIASEFVMQMAKPGAIGLTDSFEGGFSDTSLIPERFFAPPSQDVVDFHRELFTLKREPDRYLWTGQEFEEVCREACYGAAEVGLHFSMTPFNSVANWLGKSGFGLAVKQEGLMMHMATPPALKDELGLVISQAGEPVRSESHDQLLAAYFQAEEQQRESMEVDAKVSRVFANVVITKAA